MSLWRRKAGGNLQTITRDDEAEHSVLAVAEFAEQSTSPLDIFFDLQAEALMESRQLWNDVTASIDFSRDPEFTAKLYEAMVQADKPEFTLRKGEKGKVTGNYTTRKPSKTDASLLATDLGLLNYLAVRYYSRADKSETMALTRSSIAFVSRANPYLKEVFNKSVDASALAHHNIRLLRNIRRADTVTDGVLEELLEMQGRGTDLILLLAEDVKTSKDGPSQEVEELRRIIGMDWWREDLDNSQLRTYLEKQKNNPEAFINEFINAVIQEKGNRKYQQIREMARFALTALGMRPEESIAVILKDSRPVWNSFEQIESAYRDFVTSRLIDLQAAIIKIAAPKNDASIKVRLSRTSAEVKDMSKMVDNFMLTRNDKKLYSPSRAEVMLPSLADLQTTTEKEKSAEAVQRPLYGIRRVPGNRVELRDITIDDIFSEFDLENFPAETRSDITKMVESLLAQPLGAGTKKLASNKARIRINENIVKLRRFSPLDRGIEGGYSSKESKYFRVVYAISHNGIVLADILQHKEFDQKYD